MGKLQQLRPLGCDVQRSQHRFRQAYRAGSFLLDDWQVFVLGVSRRLSQYDARGVQTEEEMVTD